ncbi:ParB N-terminal domain-containing protein [Actibacterium sp. 188UL27-1]|uniref:ParB/RepB/Spo0J family partition protein n=1 Tax=Actibacterium sp. 188UL27-1 TaxID=2786961 RepID=UPI001957510E|nr:ParB N-terminal domain-containing protein [Actibacterium sp. 188UL27-1]MBM7070218.1 ParB N-terminal domain-containing protein [Actibacterium sp. 188UL27-1]
MARRRLTPAAPKLETKSAFGGGKESTPRLTPPIAQVAGQSAEAAALHEVTEEIARARATGRMVLEVPLEQIKTGFLRRDRLALDPEELEALKSSIRAHGQRTPAEVSLLDIPPPDPNGVPEPHQPYGLVSGWRRFCALSALHGETGEARFATLRALVRAPEDSADSYVAMVEENEVRVGLSYYERAQIVAWATRLGVFDSHYTALKHLFATASRAKRSKIGSFITIHQELSSVLYWPRLIGERLGLALAARLKEGQGDVIFAALKAADCQSPEQEQAALERVVKGDVSRAKRPPATPESLAPETLTKDIDMVLTQKAGRLDLRLTGAGVTDDFADRLRQALTEIGKG